MPLSGGTAGAHDDAMHQGSAKRDVADGVAGLDSNGIVLAPGYGVMLTRSGLGNILIYERTSGEDALRLNRAGANDYIGAILSGGAHSTIQLENMKDAVSGIASLDASGHLLIPAYRIYAARGASGQVTFRERTSDERMMRLIRNGADDYEGRINVAGTEQRILTMRDLCVEEYSNHLGAVDNFTQTITGGNGTANTDAANHEMDLSTGLNIVGYGGFQTKSTYALATMPLVSNFVVQNLQASVGGNYRTMWGLKSDFTLSTIANCAVFDSPATGASDYVKSQNGGAIESTAITPVANGDLLTIVATTTSIMFFVNGVLVGTHTAEIPAANLRVGAVIHATSGGISTAGLASVDMMSMKRIGV